jgi:RNA polymerase subunit RPABC4/transcription elongation factor Spt4
MKLKYKCPTCEVKSYSKYWNAETRKKYGKYSDGEICEIQEEETNSNHLCPKCKREFEWFKGELIVYRVNIIT